MTLEDLTTIIAKSPVANANVDLNLVDAGVTKLRMDTILDHLTIYSLKENWHLAALIR